MEKENNRFTKYLPLPLMRHLRLFVFKIFDSSVTTAIIRLFSTLNLLLCYVLIWVKAEEVTSHKKLDPKDKGSLRPYFPKSGHCDSVLSVCLIFSPQSEDTSINCFLQCRKPAAAALSPTEMVPHPVQFNRCSVNITQIWLHLSVELRGTRLQCRSSVCLSLRASKYTAHIYHTSPLSQSDLAYETINLVGFLFLHLVVISSVHPLWMVQVLI